MFVTYPFLTNLPSIRTHVTGTIAGLHNDFGVVGVVRSGKMNLLVAQVS
jgi:hypothetical protein